MSKLTPIQISGADASKPAKKIATSSVSGQAAPKTTSTKAVVKKAVVMKIATKKSPVAKTTVAKSLATKPVAKAPAAKSTIKAKPIVNAKTTPKAKPQKVKMERDSFTMPKEEYAQLGMLKARLAALGQPAKKSELLRAGIKLLVAMSDNTLKMTMGKIPVIKTGRPKKK